MIKIDESQKCEFIQNDQVLSFTEIIFWYVNLDHVIISIYYVIIFFSVIVMTCQFYLFMSALS